MSLYEGCRRSTFQITKDGTPLAIEPSQAVIKYSVGFSWAYVGQGPMQTALALLLDACGKDDALAYHRDYCFQVVAMLDQSKPWTLTTEAITSWVQAKKALLASNGATTAPAVLVS